jgi:hypothetical protein
MQKYYYFMACIGFSAILFNFSACNNATESKPDATDMSAQVQPLKKYYYPLAQLKDGLVYEYTNDSSNLVDYFWFYKTVEDESGNWFLLSTRYNTKFEQDQIVRERVYAEGTNCESYQFLQADTSGKSQSAPCRLKETVMFPFDVPKKKDLVYRFQMEFNLPADPDLTYRVTRDRRFDRLAQEKYADKMTDCAIFENLLHVAVGDSVHGGHWKIDSSRTTEIYAENIGLVKTVLRVSAGGVASHRLTGRYTMDEFIAKYKINQ